MVSPTRIREIYIFINYIFFLKRESTHTCTTHPWNHKNNWTIPQGIAKKLRDYTPSDFFLRDAHNPNYLNEKTLMSKILFHYVDAQCLTKYIKFTYPETACIAGRPFFYKIKKNAT